MILKSLSLINFRKFRREHVDFPDGVVGVFGLNGVGKSTLFEAVAWALYGPVAARTSSDEIKRVGASISDRCRVVVEFVFNENNYRVIREMIGKNLSSSAVAIMNGKVVAQGAEATTHFIQKLFGMDAKSFFTSLFAKQKELNALSMLSPSERKQLIMRMLGIDVLDDVIRNIRSDIKGAENAIRRDAESLVDSTTGRPKKEVYMEKISIREKEVKNLLNELNLIKGKIDILNGEVKALMVDKNRVLRSYEDIQRELRELRKKKDIYEKRKRLEHDIEKIEKSIEDRENHLKRKEKEISEFKEIDFQIQEVDERIKEVEKKISEIIKSIQSAETEIGIIDKEIRKIESKKNRIESLGPSAECPTCERVLGKHYHRLISKFDGEISDSRKNREKIARGLEENVKKKAELDNLREALYRRKKYLTDLKIKERELNTAIESIKNELKKEKREKQKMEQELKSIPVVSFDMNQIQKLEEQSASYYEQLKQKDIKLGQKQNKLRDVREQLKEKEGELKLVREKIKELKTRIKEHEEIEKRIEKERENLSDLNLLEEVMVSFKINIISRIRPTISLYASKLLETLTDGKYSILELNENYDILIYDSGKAHTISRFSGGEEDIANLCIRLAISEMLTERTGGEFNFIILDEVFGSQDTNRRRNIISALNMLSSRFRQIFIITHIEDVKQFVNNAISIYELEDGTSKVKME